VTSIDLSGTITSDGQLSGTFIFITFAGNAFNSNGNGTFTGFLTGNTIILNFLGKTLVGERCTITGSASASR
jgi:hypothetical protein